jgi:Ca2+-binding RTX toxin-like protein
MAEFFDGHLDDIAIYDTQISDDQASDLYDSGVQDVIDNGGDVDFVQFPLDVMASLTDIDGSVSLSIMIDGLPDGGALSSGTDNGDGSWSVDIDGLEGLTVSVPVGSDNFAMTVFAMATDEGGDSRTATEIVPVDVEGHRFIADVSGTARDDTLSGTADADMINSGAGNYDIDAGAGDDIVMAGDGDETVASGDGDDIIDGGTKNDTIDNGAGDDLFIFGAGDGSDYFNGGDGWSDTVQLEGVDSGPSVDSGWALQVEGRVGDTETENGIEFDEEVAGSITLSDGSELTFDGVEKLEW